MIDEGKRYVKLYFADTLIRMIKRDSMAFYLAVDEGSYFATS